MTIGGQLPALTWAIFVAWGLGCLLLAELSLSATLRSRIRPLWYLMASELAIIAIGVLPWHLPGALLVLVIMAAGARLGFEAGHVYGLVAGKRLAIPYAASMSLAAAVFALLPLTVAVSLVAGLLAVAVPVLANSSPASVPSVNARFVFYPLVPFLAFALAGYHGNSALMVLAFLFVELFDSFSLLGGKLFGRTLLVPRLSPRKTWEGLATGYAALLFSCWLLSSYLGVGYLQLLMLATLAAAAAIAGDLAASAIKRKAGVKDYPAVLPVQGGLLDIVDAWIVAAPLLVLGQSFFSS